MAGFTLLALLDDISTVLDDVAILTKMAAQKTAGVVGDDLALTAEGLSGLRAARELPVVWAVSKGSLVNKLILIPLALLISALASFLIAPLLMVGGAYLCQEGAEKVWELLLRLFRKKKGPSLTEEERESLKAPGAAPGAAPGEAQGVAQGEAQGEISTIEPVAAGPAGDLLLFEKRKIKGAIRTDFVLSAEIITIALGVIPQNVSLLSRAGALVLVGLVMTAGVYGFVALIVKLDDLGYLFLEDKDRGRIKDFLGRLLVGAAPYIMRFLAIVGTIAMFLVGGAIIFHHMPVIGKIIEGLGPMAYPVNIGLGLAVGFFILPIVTLVEKMIHNVKTTRSKKSKDAKLIQGGEENLGSGSKESPYGATPTEDLVESMRVLADEIFLTQEEKSLEIAAALAGSKKPPQGPENPDNSPKV